MPSEKMMVYMGDVYDVRNVIIWVSVGAVICGFLFMIILRFTIGVVVWILIVLYFVALLLLAWAFWQKSQNLSYLCILNEFITL